jgi:hypothetical protein
MDVMSNILFFLMASFGAAVISFVARRAPEVDPSRRTSTLLREGEPVRAELVTWDKRGAPFMDRQPMVSMRLRVMPVGEAAFDLTVVQPLPAAFLRELEEGMSVEVRLSPDRTAGAVVFD